MGAASSSFSQSTLSTAVACSALGATGMYVALKGLSTSTSIQAEVSPRRLPEPRERLVGQTALVTGAGSGIGRAAAMLLALEGAAVLVNDVSACSAEETVSMIHSHGGLAEAFVCDVSDRTSVAKMIEAAVKLGQGRIDICVSNAYASVRKPFLDLEVEDFQKTTDVTLLGGFHVCQLAARHMVRQAKHTTRGVSSRIIVISSVMAAYPYLIDTSAPYSAAKSGLDNLVRTMASSLAPHGIAVNGIHPGWIDTGGERQFTTPSQMLEMGKFLPFGLGKADDIAAGVLYLAQAAYITGSTLTIDGGFGIAQRIPGIHAPLPL